MGAIPAATATPAPLEDPPGVRSGSHGLRGMPRASLSVKGTAPNSEVVVFPSSTNPASTNRCTTGSDCCGWRFAGAGGSIGRGPAGHIEEVLDRQRDAEERWKVLGRRGTHDRVCCGGGRGADVVVGPVAERVELGVKFVDPLEIAIGHLERAHLLAAYGRGELERPA